MITILLAVLAAQDYPGDMPISRVLVEGEGWHAVGERLLAADGLAVDRQGDVLVSDPRADRIYKLDAAGKATTFAGDTAGTLGLMVGPDDRVYGCRAGEKKIVAYGAGGAVATVAEGIECSRLVVNSAGEIFASDPKGGKVWHLSPGGRPKEVADGLRPLGLALSPDQGTLAVTDFAEPVLWAFRVGADGLLAHKDRYFGPLRMIEGRRETGAGGMTVDKAGRFYVATPAGLQMFDPTGRMGGVIAGPQKTPLVDVVFGGPEFAYLYVTTGDRVYRRKTKSPGEPYFLRAKSK